MHRLTHPTYNTRPPQPQSFLVAAALLVAALICLAVFPGCSGPSVASSTPTPAAPAATPVDLGSQPLGYITSLTRDAVQADPSLAPYVESVASWVRSHATDTAPTPAELQVGANLLALAAPKTGPLSAEIIAWYSGRYGDLTKLESASPFIEQLAEAIEAGAS